MAKSRATATPWQPVQSSNLAAVRWNPARGTLDIRFKSGRWYRYLDVPVHVYFDLMAASSKGKFHHRFIRDRYAFEGPF